MTSKARDAVWTVVLVLAVVTAAVVFGLWWTRDSDDGPSQEQLCAVALIEGHDAYYDANCTD